jgi:hypothetical protein
MYAKAVVLSHLYINAIFLPRQARDKHRENSKKAAIFSGGAFGHNLHAALQPAGKKKVPSSFRCHVILPCDMTAKHLPRQARDRQTLGSSTKKGRPVCLTQHLLGVEAPLSIMSAVRLGKSTGAAFPAPRAELVAVADRDLRGETPDKTIS